MTQPAKTQEPTMEEILASIRRIIADEEAVKPPASAAAPQPPGTKFMTSLEPPPAPVEPPDELESLSAARESLSEVEPPREPLDDIEATPAAEAVSGLHDFDADPDDGFGEPPPAPSPPRPAGQHLRALEPPLLSAEATAAVNSAFGTLAHTVLVQNATTLEDLVKEMLRPLLKTWLDDNLPRLVERLVRTEIERVSRGHPG
jgi:cell pole-organizing protein PopZ